MPRIPDDSALRQRLVEMLHGGHSHITFDDAVRGFPVEKAGLRPDGLPHSAWELLEHLRIAQYDILEFSRSADYHSPEFPKGYWPRSHAPEHTSQWHESVGAFRKDLEAFVSLIGDSAQDLNQEFPWGDGQTLLREALVLASHNSYHIGQLVLVRRAVEH